MRRGWWLAGVTVLCLPLVFASWLMLAAHWWKMDAFTMRMPMAVRSLVAEVIAQSGTERGLAKRAARLDPNVEALRAMSPVLGNRRTVYIDSAPRALNLYKKAQQQEQAGDQCAAGETYTEAASADSGDDTAYMFVEHMGRAELRCGDLLNARAGLETAVEKEQRVLKTKDSDYEDSSSAKIDLAKDEEYLVVVYGRQKEKDLAKQACTVAHPAWSSCACRLSGNDVVCSNAK